MVDETESKIAHNYEEGDQQRKMKYESGEVKPVENKSKNSQSPVQKDSYT